MSDEFFFDPEQEEGSRFELVPAGAYIAQIIEAEIGPPRSGDGTMLKLTWKITAGEHEGRQLWQTICYVHSSAQTTTIARRTLKDLCDALDIHEQINDPEIFKYKPALIRVGVEVDKTGQYDDQNRIRRIKPLTETDGETLEAKQWAKSKNESEPRHSRRNHAPAQNNNGLGAAPWKRTGK